MKKADPIYIEHYLKEKDGKDEFFELVDKSLDVVDYVKSIVRSCTSKDYTAAVKEVIDLDFNDKYHLVNNEIIEKIEEKFQEVDDILFNHKEDSILLIGQFEPDFVASFAMHNKVMIWHDTKEQRHLFNYSRLNNNITYFEGTLEEFIEETKGMKFNLIIANPPYGKIGANITKKIIDEVEFDYYINLLPANDYKRNDSKDLFKYQSDMKPINDGFIDAAVTTHVARIHKGTAEDPAPNINMTLEEFERSQYIDRSLDKYFAENSKRTHYAIDNHICKPKIARFKTIDLRKCFYTGKRDLAAGHLPYSKDSMSYKINFNLLTDHDEFLANSSKSEQALGNSGNYTVVPFNTNEEKDNLIKFLYSKLGFKFICKLFTAINVDCYVVPSKYLPKVDWTRSWTVEEILKDYGYTEDEIKEVMEDLKNFKGMDD